MLRIFWLFLLPLALKAQTLTVNSVVTYSGGPYSQVIVQNGGTLNASGTISNTTAIVVESGGIVNAGAIASANIAIQSGGTINTESLSSISNLDLQGGTLNVISTSGTKSFSGSTLTISGAGSTLVGKYLNNGFSNINVTNGNNVNVTFENSTFYGSAVNVSSSTYPFRLNVVNTTFNYYTISTSIGSEFSFTSGSNVSAGTVSLSGTKWTMEACSLVVTSNAAVAGNSDVSLDNCQAILQSGFNQTDSKLKLDNNSLFEVRSDFDVSGTTSIIEMTNSSFVRCYGDYYNHTGITCYPPGSQADFRFASSDKQEIDGINVFYNLSFSGGGYTVINNTGSTEVSNLLTIGNEIVEIDNVLSLSNASTYSLSVGSGFIYCRDNTNVKFSRNTNSTDSYLFPVGSYVSEVPRYRPVIIIPSSNTAATYGVKFENTVPLHSASALGGNLKKINETFFHRVSSNLGCKLHVFYNSATDGVWNNAALWNNTLWNLISLTRESPINNYGLVSAGGTLPSTSNSFKEIVLADMLVINPSTDVSCAVLVKQLDGSYHEVLNGLNFKFEENYTVKGSETLNYTIYNAAHVDVTGGQSLPVQVGDNRFLLNTAGFSTGMYTLEVKNSKGDKWYLRFKK